jgi:hypothetical protein
VPSQIEPRAKLVPGHLPGTEASILERMGRLKEAMAKDKLCVGALQPFVLGR